MTRRLLLVRHGVTTWNREGRFQGHLDPPLDAIGELEARYLAERLVDERLVSEQPLSEQPDPMRIVTSPLRRAADTAAILARALSANRSPAQVTTDRRLMEIGQGEWEGHTHAELAHSDPVRYTAWRAGGGTVQPPGAETVEAALGRVSAAIDELVTDASSPICLVSHGGILRLAARHLLELEPRRAWSLDVDNASLSRLSTRGDDDGWRIDAWNDTAHLLGRTAQHMAEAEGEPLAL